MEEYIIDFDGVVLDSQTKFDEYMKGNRSFFAWNQYLNSIDWHEFYRTCNQIDDSFSTLVRLQYLKKLRAILTTIHSFYEGQEKSVILRENGIHVPVVFVLPNQCKSFIYPPQKNVILVDDKEGNCLDYESAGGKSLLFNPKYEGKSKKIVKSLKELL